ncbi:MAG: hypothetical protein JOZ69_21920, partial [Myxococcales bacterium]|nr:hypothetical protein [Myxococcales bacterium]
MTGPWRAGRSLLAAAALAGAGAPACANLVGITDTEVREDGGAGADATAAPETGADAPSKPDAGAPTEAGPGGDADATLPEGGGDATVPDVRDAGGRPDTAAGSDAEGGASADAGPAPPEGGAADAGRDQRAPDTGAGGCAAPCPVNMPSCV